MRKTVGRKGEVAEAKAETLKLEPTRVGCHFGKASRKDAKNAKEMRLLTR